MSEKWRVIKAFPDYAVSSLGRVKRVQPNCFGSVGGILKQRLDRYACLTLYVNKKPFLVSVHRLVCTAFHGNPPTKKHHAAHNDGNGLNNAASNLRWATANENEADKILHGRSLLGKPSTVPPHRRPRGLTHGRYTMPEKTARGERTATSKLTEKKIVQIRKDSRSRKEIAADYGITVTMVGYIVRGISWAHIPMENGK